MATPAGTVEVIFAAETASIRADLKKVQDQLKGMDSSFASISKVAKGALGFLSVGALVGFSKSLFESANELDRLNQKTGIAVESLSRLQFAAGQADTEFSSLTAGITQFQKRLASGDATRAIERIGLNFEQIRYLAPEQQLIEIARGFQTLNDPAKRVAISMELFGKAGADLIPFLLQGPEGIAKLTRESDALGATLDASTVAALDRAEKQANRLIASLKGVATQLLAIASRVILGPEQETQADKLVKLMERERDLQAEIKRLQDPSVIVRLSLSEDERAKAIEKANSALQINLGLISEINKKELERLNTQKLVKELSSVADIGEVSVTAKRVRVAGSPENFDELRQDFDEQELETNKKEELERMRAIQAEFEQLQLTGAENLSKELSRLDEERANEAQFWRQYELDREAESQENLLRIKQEGYNAAQSLLTAYGGKYKKFAQLLLIQEKLKATAAIIIDTQAAASKALATYGPTPVGFGAAGLAIAFGAARLAVVASTFIGGNSAPQLGSSGNPTFTSNADTSFSRDEQPTAESSRTVQVILNGNIYNTDDFRASVADALKDLDDVDTIIFSSNGAQAQTIRNA